MNMNTSSVFFCIMFFLFSLFSSVLIISCKTESDKKYYEFKYGKWETDQNELPYFKADLKNNPIHYYSFPHLSSTGNIAMLADQWGNINVLTTEGGTIALNPNSQHSKSAMYTAIQIKNEKKTLLYSHLNKQDFFSYGVGNAKYYGSYKNDSIEFEIQQTFYTPPNYQRNFIGIFKLINNKNENIETEFSLQSDLYPMPAFGLNEVFSFNDSCGKGIAMLQTDHYTLHNIFIVSDLSFNGKREENTLILNKTISLKPGDTLTVKAAFGYGNDEDLQDAIYNIRNLDETEIGNQWAKRLEKTKLNTPEKWMQEECVWTFSQLLAFANHDYSLDEHFITLGGYGYFSDPNNQVGYGGFASREVGETAMPLSYFDPELAKESLFWLAKTQLKNGNILDSYNYQKKININHLRATSDDDIWFLLACGEYLKNTGDTSFLSAKINYWNEESRPMYDHIKKAFYWLRDSTGTGKHNLIKMREGDWNDCISKLAKKGYGESVMNSGMAARATANLLDVEYFQKDKSFIQDLEDFALQQRAAVAKCFDEKWFIRAYSDTERPVGTYAEDRLYINAQSWAALGGCGTAEQRKTALLTAIEKCQSDIGLTLISRPYSCPQPKHLTDYSNPVGEGENAGIWPQTVFWMIWALAEEGLIDEAMEEWKSMSLRNHADKCQEVPFGIINGPDCYSSKYAGTREGWTQIQAWRRMIGTPMNPMVAWQAFAMKKIIENQ